MRIFVSSPLRGDLQGNTEFAKKLCSRVAALGHSPYAPHLFCTHFLDDTDLAQRKRGLDIGQDFLRVCNELWYETPEKRLISSGMWAEIELAESLGIPARRMSSFLDIK